MRHRSFCDLVTEVKQMNGFTAMSETDWKDDYPHWVVEKLRYNDCDMLGHVNNAVFSTMLEAGRVHFLIARDDSFTNPGATFVIARLELNYRNEMNWPGDVMIGTRVRKVGGSSLTLEQVIMQGDTCAAESLSILVQMDQTTRKSTPFSESARARLNALKKPMDSEE